MHQKTVPMVPRTLAAMGMSPWGAIVLSGVDLLQDDPWLSFGCRIFVYNEEVSQMTPYIPEDLAGPPSC